MTLQIYDSDATVNVTDFRYDVENFCSAFSYSIRSDELGPGKEVYGDTVSVLVTVPDGRFFDVWAVSYPVGFFFLLTSLLKDVISFPPP